MLRTNIAFRVNYFPPIRNRVGSDVTLRVSSVLFPRRCNF